MSYNKISQKTKEGFDGAKDVTPLQAIHFTNEPVPSPKVEGEDETVPEDKLSKTLHPTLSSPSASLTSVANHTKYPRRSKSVNLESCKIDASPTYFDKELDVNSAASALRKAIEKAQESVRIAKESVGRRRRGLQSFSNRKFKDSFEVEGNMEDVTAATSQVFPDFMDGKKLFIAKKVMDAINEKFSESNKECVIGVMGETESRPHDSAGKDEYATLSSDVVDTETTKTGALDFVHGDQTCNMFVNDYGGIIEVVKTTTDVLEHQEVEEDQVPVERVGLDVLRLLKENTDEVRLSNALESVKEANNLNVSEKMEDEMGLEVSKGSNQNDNEKILNALENEKQMEFFEENNVENAENAKTDKGIEEGFEWPENENESIDDHYTEIHKEEGSSEIFYDDCEPITEVSLRVDSEIKQEDYNITVERKGESLDESCDQEFNVKSAHEDKVSKETDSIDGIYVAGNIVDMNEKPVETTQEIDDVTEASSKIQLEDTMSEKEDICEKTSMDQIASDNNEDEYEATSEENNELYETSSSTTHCVKIEVYEYHKQKNIINNLADLSSENDVQAESYSCITNGVKIEEEESNIQSPDKEIPNTGYTNEVNDSQEPQYNDKEDEVVKPGPSKMSGQDHFRRIFEEAAAKEREREKSRLAVERAISEARDRAFAEARERAERQRAAVEIAIEEARQRMIAEAHEKVTKASVANKSSSVQSKLRAEHAAVERATSEARQHALDKTMSQKTVSNLNSSEPVLRTKTKLEKHNRIMEKAAKALAEKQKRDRLAQKEQAERNRLAENLDADIKRWSNGKEGNLRALLSTLQYILGPESGWQPVSLTHMTTTSDVKKAYRKATLCVHPDKLQQWGSSIQHKYICEKVFNLLKVAWKTFNSEEGSRLVIK